MSEYNFDDIVNKSRSYTSDLLKSSPDFQDENLDKVEKAQSLFFRKDLVDFVKNLTTWWFIGLGIIFGVTGITNILLIKPFMSDSVLIALLGCTSLLGLIAIILRSLFRNT